MVFGVGVGGGVRVSSATGGVHCSEYTIARFVHKIVHVVP